MLGCIPFRWLTGIVCKGILFIEYRRHYDHFNHLQRVAVWIVRSRSHYNLGLDNVTYNELGRLSIARSRQTHPRGRLGFAL